MKRHKYVFPRYLKKFNKKKELFLLALKFLKRQNILKNPSFTFCLKKKLKKNFIPWSKINTYCLITGRVHYTIKKTQTSRHIFFEWCREGYIPGFFFAS